ncbi:MAG: FAD-dependent oxidoreductase, partial [Pirellulaceae bacterium]|nr:FAD-dependent oxidoreductase [Pirellulaceae bacterium]
MKDHQAKEIEQTDAVVVGGGLAGFIAAAKLARAGRSVALLEQGKQLGGRAATSTEGGVHLNLGPRALYCQGHAFRLLRELDVPVRGALPAPGIALGYYRGREHRLPGTLSSLFWTRLLSPAQKWRLAHLLRELPHLDTSGLTSTSTAQWVRRRYGTGALADYLFTSFRLTTYVADMEQLSAGAAIDQLKLGLAGNVWYLDGGWQSLIEGLRRAAVRRGAIVRSGSHVASVRAEAGGVLVELPDRVIRANIVVLAIPPRNACETLSLPAEHPLVRWLASAQPVRAACLDVALAKLPRPQHRFALGVDQPLYFSVHSAAAQLAPDGVAVLHVMKYLESRESAPLLEEELQHFLERVAAL